MNNLTPNFHVELFNVINATIKQSHFELYKCMRLKGEAFSLEDLLHVYNNFGRNVSRRVRRNPNEEMTELQNKANAIGWFNNAVVILLKAKYFKIDFNVSIDANGNAFI